MTTRDSVLAFQHRDWASVPVERIAEGIDRQIVWGHRVMVCRLRLDAHVVTAVHSHLHEQFVIVQRGRVKFIVEGREHIASPGDILCFPSGIEHGATMLDEEVVLIDVFSPIREDFLPKGGDGGW